MKKFLPFLISGFIFQVSASPTSEVKQYWDTFFPYIKQCVLDSTSSKTTYNPVLKVLDTMSLKSYLSALDYSGYVVVVFTKNLTEKDLCFLRYVIQEMGYSPKYLSSVEVLVVSSFERKVDAEDMKEKVQSFFKRESGIGFQSENVYKEGRVKVLEVK